MAYFIESLLIVFILTFIPGCAKKEYIITTEPEGADVFLNGNLIGSTPLSITENNKGKQIFTSPDTPFQVEIYKEFYRRVMIEIRYSLHQKNMSHIILEISKDPLPGYDGILRRGNLLSSGEIEDMSKSELEYLKNEIYAQYGKSFHLDDISHYFNQKSWYKENPYFDDSFLTPVDKKNIELIEKRISDLSKHTVISEMIGIGKPSASDLTITGIILENREYFYDSGEEETTSLGEDKRNTCILEFNGTNTLQWIDDSNYFGTYYEGIDTHLEWNWQVYLGRVYVWDIHDDESGCIVFIFTLDHQKKQIVSFPEIDGKIWK